MYSFSFVSKDLIHFKEVGIVMKPDQEYDQELGCFSGSSIEKDGKMYVLYTGANYTKQVQCLAISEDGYNFKKYGKNPIIDEKNLPNGYLINDFRDPKVFFKNNKYYVLLTARHKDGYSSILLYSSDDLVSYQFVNVLMNIEDTMVECPDIIFEGDKCALIYSVSNLKQEDDKYQNQFLVAYTVGQLDLNKGIFTPIGEQKELDRGFECYATHTLRYLDNNYIINWLYSPGSHYDVPDAKYCGQLTLVKKINIVGDSLRMSFLPNVKTEKVQLSSEYLKINNIEIKVDKATHKVTVLRNNMDVSILDGNNKPIVEKYFYLNDVTSIDIEYIIDHSCVEISFQNGEAFFSFLNFK
jgi:beta-fructofuranosidase